MCIRNGRRLCKRANDRCRRCARMSKQGAGGANSTSVICVWMCINARVMVIGMRAENR